jgi:hypothetical protein
MGTRRSLPGGKAAGGVKLTTHLQLGQGQENVDLYVHSPIILHGVMLNELSYRDNFTFSNIRLSECNSCCTKYVK